MVEVGTFWEVTFQVDAAQPVIKGLMPFEIDDKISDRVLDKTDPMIGLWGDIKVWSRTDVNGLGHEVKIVITEPYMPPMVPSNIFQTGAYTEKATMETFHAHITHVISETRICGRSTVERVLIVSRKEKKEDADE